MSNSFNNQKNNNLNKFDEDLNIMLFLNFLLRNKKLISIFSIIFFILAYLFSLTIRRTWEGQFQIVLKSEQKESLLNKYGIADSNFTSVLNPQKENSLKTEVGILESPSVLMPIFEFVVDEKLKNIKNIKNINPKFSDWEKNLSIELERKTSILNISYRDKEKDIIIPVLSKIADAYQEYSGKRKKRNQELTKNFLENQIAKFDKQSFKSLKKAQEFAIEQNLSALGQDNFFSNGNSDVESNTLIQNRLGDLLLPNISIENIRVKAANEIRKINLQVEKINQISNDSEKLQYIGITIPALVQEGLPARLEELERRLFSLRTAYKENDKVIKKTLEERDLLINLLKKRAIGYLLARKVELEALEETASRPKEVLLKYKELIREASRDESTLIQLENTLNLTELNSAKVEDPWQLITRPTLIDAPVAPSRSKFSLLGFLIGFSLGSLFSIYKEKKSDKIYDNLLLKHYLSVSFAEEISIADIELNNEKISIIREYMDALPGENINIISLGKLNKTNLEFLQKYLKVEGRNKIIKKIQTLSDIKNSFIKENTIVVINKSSSSYSEVKKLAKYLKLFKLNVDCLLIVNSF